ncbi:autophagy-related protein 13 [Diplogelasinospora grovesii]|uniref:Autophagy-related protein 13 n=1 Tax=Diplogelasinospora grovesii TaxID=303347 RepID=A0AAN6NL86_9PEZI|nr:autophagy-related protein 13 [Diplogelasinospora grovesii]
MHQQSRHPPRVSSPASSPQTNPTRTNNQREAFGRARAGSEAASGDHDGAAMADDVESAGAGLGMGAGPSRDSIKKLDQIIQNFYSKAAVLILQSRLDLTPAGGKRGAEGRKPNKWFSIETEEIDDFRDELRVYKTSGSFENRPPPMVIESYLDASRLSSSQSLVTLDEYGKRWDALEALNGSGDNSSDDGTSVRSRHQKRSTEIILERWRVELQCTPLDELDHDEFGPNLPTIYKKSIVFFRSLFVATRIMPCWKYSQQSMAKGMHPALEVKCRITTDEPEYIPYDPLRQPLIDGRDAVTEYMLGDLEVPVGRFKATVTYRNECSFRVEDSESLLSSRMMAVDDNFFKPSIQQTRTQRQREHQRSESYGGAEIGSLPGSQPRGYRHGQGRSRAQEQPQQTYGSLSTFHGATGALAGTSPISALKAVRPIGSDTSSPTGSAAASVEQSDSLHPPHSLPIRGSAARPSLHTGRRPSVSFQPFKAGSLSGSPRIPTPDVGGEVPASPQSYTRPSASGSGVFGNITREPRNRSSLTAGMAASLRGGPAPMPVPSSGETPPAGAGSPKPTPTGRYSSSFTHRRSRPSYGGQSRAGLPDDDAVSSGKQSLSSSAAQPGSGLLAEAAGGGAASSGGSFQTDDDISEFLKALDSRKTLTSFEPTNKEGEPSQAARRTAAQLSKFQMMRESNNVLTESMTSSMHLQRSSSTSSRQLANVPSMVNPASMTSASSSPGGKPLSPHTPHTPAIPSRLSENSIIDYQTPEGQQPARTARNPEIVATEEEEENADDDTPVVTQQEGGTTAIDIPLSPRLLHAGSGNGNGNRRASSVAHAQAQYRASRREDTAAADLDIVQRSISLGADDRDEVPTLSTLLAFQKAASGSPLSLQPAADIHPTGTESQSVEGGEKSESAAASSSSPYRPRYQPPLGFSRGGRSTPNISRGSFSGSGRYGNLRGGAGIGAGEDGTDDYGEPLLFAMSELERPSRRSLEEAINAQALQQARGNGGGNGSGTAGAGNGGNGNGGGGGNEGASDNRSGGMGAVGGSGGGGGSGGTGADGREPRGTSRRGWN